MRRLLVLLLVLVSGVVLVPTAQARTAAKPNSAPTPPMGWNSWNTFGCNINEQLIRDTALKMSQNGMLAAGYKYVNIDDCWMATTRDGNGRLWGDPDRFPSGMKAMADYVHGLGMKLGIYSSAGSLTCQSKPASLTHETVDAQTFAEWGVDLLKYDNCGDYFGMPAETRYQRMGDALQATGRPILYSICEWGHNAPWLWASGKGGHMWRTTEDITSSWGSVIGIIDQQVGKEAYSGPNAWNDPDMLEVGTPGLSYAESRAHMSMWAIMNSPLIAGNDIQSMSAETHDLLTDPDVIAVNQDWAGRQGAKLRDDDTFNTEIWSKKMSGGSAAVVLLNRSDSNALISTTAFELGLPETSSYTVKNLWNNDVRASAGNVRAQVAPHDAVMFKVTPGAAANVEPMVVIEAVPAQRFVTTVGQVDVPVRFHNDSPVTLPAAQVKLNAPAGWVVTPDTPTQLGTLTAGQTSSGGYRLSASQPPQGGVELTASASWTWNGLERIGGGGGRFVVAKPPALGWVAMSELPFVYAENGWGPVERDKSVGDVGPNDGNSLRVGTDKPEKGLGAHAPSRIGFFLDGQCTQVTARVGIDAETSGNGAVRFKIWADGAQLAYVDSSGTQSSQYISANVTGKQYVELRVDTAGPSNFDHADWLEPSIECVGTPPPGGKSKLADRPWLSMTNGWGPLERNRSNGEQLAGDGLKLKVAGVEYASGLGGHANSAVSFFLGRKCTTFTTAVGIDDEVGDRGQVHFEVWSDGTRRAQADATGAGGVTPLSVDVTGVDRLELRLDSAGSVDFDHADWLTPEVTCT